MTKMQWLGVLAAVLVALFVGASIGIVMERRAHASVFHVERVR